MGGHPGKTMGGVAGFPGDGFSDAGSRGKGLGAAIGLGVLESVVCEDTMFTWGLVVGDERTGRFRADTRGGGGGGGGEG